MANYNSSANNALRQGGQYAANYMDPFTQYANQDMATAHSFLGNEYAGLQQYGNPASNFYGYLEESPTDLYESVMKNYSMSPAAQSQLKFALSGSNNAASTNGMLGSGNQQALNDEIANNIYGQDQQQYLKNIMGTTNMQQKFLDDFTKQMGGLEKGFGKLLNMEYGASGKMADIMSRLAQSSANVYSRAGQDSGRSMGNLVGDAVGLGAHVLDKTLFSGSGSGGKSPLGKIGGDAASAAMMAMFL